MTNEKGQITFDSFIRGVIGVLILVGIVMLLNRLSSVLVPFFLAWLIAYLLFPLVKFFQYRCRMKFRVLGILSAFLVTGLVLAIVFMLMIPPMVEESLRVKDLLVEYINNNETVSNIPRLIQEYVRDHLSAEQIQAIVTQDGFLEGIKVTVPRVWDVIMQSINVVSSVFTLTMVALYTLLILLDYEDINKGWPNLLPARYRSFALQVVSDVEESMNKYFRGQALVALCVGILFSIGFLIIDFPIAVGLGMFIGLLNMVPYLQLIGFVPAILLAIVKAADTGQNFWFIMLLVLIVFAVVQAIQDTILTPKIMGHVTGLHSAIILLSLSIWGSLMGILGMIIALPLTTLSINYYQKYVIRKKDLAPPQEASES
ncbi:MAG: AI-2E family transporter [Prevotella sp.]|nr:AI-2E family transporter [Prevotella sp.]